MTEATNAIAAIKARRAGVWDDPNMMAFGPLSINTEADVIAIQRAFLELCGYEIGPRDRRLNTDYKGRFMVLEDRGSVPPGAHATGQDSGSWCIVGDDLDDLITQAFDVACDVYEHV